MNQEQIGKFIATCRKKKQMTQQVLASKLGVSDRSISNWENGKNMPDLSLFKPLCQELEITMNDLLSGERVNQENYQEKLEENIVKTIDYTTKKIKKYKKIFVLLFTCLGLFLTFIAMNIFPSESSWGCIYSLVGVIFSLIGLNLLIKNLKFLPKIFFNLGYLVVTLLVLFLIDYIGVVNIHQAPRFAIIKVSGENVVYYDTPFYDVVRCMGKKNEYKVIKNQKYDIENIDVFCK